MDCMISFKHDETLHFDTTLNDFARYIWSLGNEKDGTFSVILFVGGIE